MTKRLTSREISEITGVLRSQYSNNQLQYAPEMSHLGPTGFKAEPGSQVQRIEQDEALAVVRDPRKMGNTDFSVVRKEGNHWKFKRQLPLVIHG